MRGFWKITAALTVGSLLLAACGPRGAAGTQSAAAMETGKVSAVTATSTVELSGAVQPRQSASLVWKTTGQLAAIQVKVGDQVKAGDVLMTLDPASAPQSLIQAQADLLTAQKTLNDLQHPSAVTVANAQKAVADARKTLDDKQRALKNLVSPDVAYYQDQYTRAQQNLTAARQNAQVTDFQTSLRNAKDTLDTATNDLKKYQDLEAQYPGYGQQHGDVLTKAQKTYDRAAQDYQTALYNYQQAEAKNANAITDAQTSLNTAQGNLAAAKAGADPIKKAQAEAEVTVAQAKLDDAQQTLKDMQNGGNADDVAAAKAKITAIQASLAALTLTAPFAGEVLAVNNLPGDPVTQNTVALELANRNPLHVDVSVDESDITAVKPGNPASLTFDPIPGLTITGTVESIDPVGQTVQGLVRYTVRVTVATSDPRVLMGMTANVKIITAVQANALAVPFRAVQSDKDGEYVNRVAAGGAVERVPVVSGIMQGDLIVVTGNLQAGEIVQVPTTIKTNPGGPFGGG